MVISFVSHVCNNLQYALKEPEIVDVIWFKRSKRGFMIRPYNDPHFSKFCINPISIATRKYSGKNRLTIDLPVRHDDSAPSIDSLIALTPFSLFYASVDNAIKLTGKGAWLSKADITDAFKG